MNPIDLLKPSVGKGKFNNIVLSFNAANVLRGHGRSNKYTRVQRKKQ